jgi:glycosyl hydrolase family 10
MVFDKGNAAQQLPLHGSYMFAQDEIPVRGQLQFDKGQLVGVRHSDTPVGLNTLWDVADFGKVMLQTTRLPEKDKPYNLNVELARSRLLRISQKREDWNSSDLDLSEQDQGLIEKSLEKLISALCHLDEPQIAAQYADESLSYSLPGGEALAQAHAKLFLERRNSTQGFGRHTFGCCIEPQWIKDPKYQKFIKENFHFVTIPMCWSQIEPKEQEQNFSVLDECIAWLSRNRIAVKVGPLVSFSPTSVPDWLFIWEHDFEQVREMTYDFISKVVERYGHKVQAWDVISSMNVENCFKFSFDQIIEMTRSAALAAKRTSPRSLVLIEISEPWGEYYAVNQRTVPPMIYADMICQSGVPFDGFGLRLRFGRGAAGMQMRDLLELSTLIDRFGVFGKPLHLSGVQVPSKPDPRDNSGKIGEAGSWHGTWTEALQAQWLEKAYRVALSKPFVETVTWQDLIDRDDRVLQNGGLFNKEMNSKPAFEKLRQLKTELVRQGHSSSSKKSRMKE